MGRDASLESAVPKSTDAPPRDHNTPEAEALPHASPRPPRPSVTQGPTATGTPEADRCDPNRTKWRRDAAVASSTGKCESEEREQEEEEEPGRRTCHLVQVCSITLILIF
ncbi:hypothetical protein E2C01_065809 [Portunus trituberculatus]|uniref:Uncharacterized protein n=1 Tax=Portunus trituberculatus TaxID=210409 RepID=A0A5B7HJV8_PORTR|nr:hypothetical protein [Portunus trituberculatus]